MRKLIFARWRSVVGTVATMEEILDEKYQTRTVITIKVRGQCHNYVSYAADFDTEWLRLCSSKPNLARPIPQAKAPSDSSAELVEFSLQIMRLTTYPEIINSWPQREDRVLSSNTMFIYSGGHVQ